MIILIDEEAFSIIPDHPFCQRALKIFYPKVFKRFRIEAYDELIFIRYNTYLKKKVSADNLTSRFEELNFSLLILILYITINTYFDNTYIVFNTYFHDFQKK